MNHPRASVAVTWWPVRIPIQEAVGVRRRDAARESDHGHHDRVPAANRLHDRLSTGDLARGTRGISRLKVLRDRSNLAVHTSELRPGGLVVRALVRLLQD